MNSKHKHDIEQNPLNEIQIPAELSSVVRRAVSQAEIDKKRVKNRWGGIKPAIAAASILIILTVTGFSTTIAAFISDFIKNDKGYTNIAKKGYVQSINKSAEDKGVKVTITDVIMDSREILIFYNITNNTGYKYVAGKVDIIDRRDNLSLLFNGRGDINKKIFNNFDGTNNVIGVSKESGYTPSFASNWGDIRFECSSFSVSNDYFDLISDSNGARIDGKWNIDVKLDTKLAEVKPEIFKSNAEGNLDGNKFIVQEIESHPTITAVKIKPVDKKEIHIQPDYNFYLEDENGTRFDMKTVQVNNTGGNVDMVLYFESSYFEDSRELNMVYDKSQGTYDNAKLLRIKIK